MATQLVTPDGASDLRSLVEDYERRLILSALSSCGGQKNRAAAALGVLPTTLHEKMKRLSIAAEGAGGIPPGTRSVSLDAPADEFRWRGRLARGAALEVRGISGGVRALRADGDEVEVVAVRRSRAGAGHLALSVLEHERGAVFSVHETRPSSARKCHVDFELRIPEQVSLVVRILAGNVEIVGLRGEVEAHTLSGQVRFLTAATPDCPA